MFVPARLTNMKRAATKKTSHDFKIPVIHVKDLKKHFRVGGKKVPVLKNINLTIAGGEFVVIFGPSGCGKSTLLNTLVGLESPSTGTVYVHGRNIFRLTSNQKADVRNKTFGMLYQQSHWVNSLDVIENVAFSYMINGRHPLATAMKRAEHLLEIVGMEQFRHYRPTELSGGQQQRVGLARALIMDPEILVADEPTGNLDTKAGWEVIHLLQSYIADHAKDDHPKTIIMVTHNVNYIGVASQRLAMEDGMVVAHGDDVIQIAMKNLDFEKQESKVKFFT